MPSIVTGPAKSGGASAAHGVRKAPFGPHSGRALAVAGLITLIGSLVDLGVLWVMQRQPGIQWEFVAITRTAEAWPRLVLAVGLVYGGAHLAEVTSGLIYKSLAVVLVALGFGGLLLGAILMLNYLSVEGAASGAAGELVRSAVVKTLLLCALYVVLLVPTGVMGLKSPRT